MRSLGVDVGVAKGTRPRPHGRATRRRSRCARTCDPRRSARCIDEFRPDVVAIDSPPRWAATGRSRRTERELAVVQHPVVQHAVARPTARGNRFFEWMEVGFEVFRVGGRARLPDLRRRIAEGPGHGGLPARDGRGAGRQPAAERRLEARRGASASCAPRECGRTSCTSIDRLDAALAALTGLLALEGKRFAPGDPHGGRHHAAGEHAARHSRSAKRPRARPTTWRPLFNYCACGDPDCHALVRGEFAPGHDAKRKAMLWRRAREGAGSDRGARGARMEATPGDAVGAERFETRAIHAGQDPEALVRLGQRPDLPDRPPTRRTTVGRPKRWDYARGGNPTREAFQVALAALEGGSARVRVRERHGRRDHAAAHAAARRSRGARRRRVRRDVPAARERALGLGARRSRPCDLADAAALRDAIRPTHQARVGRDALEPAC